MPRYRYFAVKGNGSFPFQLLALDECYPASPQEADKITLACPTVAPTQTIRLCSHNLDTPHTQAWKEANWPVEHVS